MVVGAVRERLPRKRNSKTFSFRVADCEGYVTVGEYEDGRPGEVFIKVSKQGSTLAGIMDAFSIAISLGLQHGVPLATFVRKYANMKFEPAGITDDPELRIAIEPGRLHLPPAGARLPLGGGAHRPRRAVDAGADAADAARAWRSRRPRRSDWSTTAAWRGAVWPLRGAGPDEFAGVPLGPGGSAAGPGGAARRAVLLQLRQPHAAGRVLLRLRELRDDERLLVNVKPRVGDTPSSRPTTPVLAAGVVAIRGLMTPACGCSPLADHDALDNSPPLGLTNR